MLNSWDARREYIVAGDIKKTIEFAAENWIHLSQRAIQQTGKFAVALSGGSTPKAIYETLIQKKGIEWSKIFLFWSDERAVLPSHPDSNYKMAMESFQKVPIPPSQIFRMVAEKEIEKGAFDYQETIRRVLGKHLFDLVMLGIGEDGHTASLFPNTEALNNSRDLVLANYIPQKKCWRMTLTFPCIEQSSQTIVYAIGSSKQKIVPDILKAPLDSCYPASRIGTEKKKALWILDEEAAKFL